MSRRVINVGYLSDMAVAKGMSGFTSVAAQTTNAMYTSASSQEIQTEFVENSLQIEQ